MRLDFVKVFRDSTSEMFQQIVGPVDEMDSLAMSATPVAGRGVTAVIELDGQAQGRVIIDMDAGTAVRIAGRLLDEPEVVMTPIAQSAISELASMIIGHAPIWRVSGHSKMTISASLPARSSPRCRSDHRRVAAPPAGRPAGLRGPAAGRYAAVSVARGEHVLPQGAADE